MNTIASNVMLNRAATLFISLVFVYDTPDKTHKHSRQQNIPQKKNFNLAKVRK